MALLVVPRLGTNPSNVRVQYIFGLGDALSLMACLSRSCSSPFSKWFLRSGTAEKVKDSY